MTGSAATAEQSRSLDPTASQVWRAVRGPAAVAGVVLLAALLLAVVAGTSSSGLLDPRAVDPAGSRALAELLRDQGVDVRMVTTSEQVRSQAGPDDTLLVAFPDRLVGSQVATVDGTGADLVLVTPTSPERFAGTVRTVDATEPEVRQPGCALPAAARAGSADTGGVTYGVEAGTGAVLCYARDGKASLVQVASQGRTVTVIGNDDAFSNEHLDDEGNAALTMGLLGAHQRLLWYLPSLDDVPAEQTRTFYELVPEGVWWGLGQLVVGVLLLALWRARRLGPVVPEPLPVVVRAAETVEGRARLYRRSGARDKAAQALRAGVHERVRPLLGLPRAAGPLAVVDAVAGRTRRTLPEVQALLYGSAPPDDAALVRLADDLDALEREVRRP